MPIHMPADTRAAVGADAAQCESRSLYLDRFTDPGAKDSGDNQPRRDWFNNLRGKQALSVASDSRHEWLTQFGASGKGQLLLAQLQSRLMVNMAGGVMENAGLCLDRFGVPYIPGSAVKGCGRRAALAALHEWCDTSSKPAGDDNLFAPSCAPFHLPAEMLADIARVFGWSEQDWSSVKKDGRHLSDFAWACGDRWDSVRTETFQLLETAPEPTSPDEALADRTGPPKARDIGEARCDGSPSEWRGARGLRIKHFAGSVSFLPAYSTDTGKVDGLPLEVPELGKLELDVVTCHHPDYYGRKENERGGLIMPIALDSEQRILPIIFPTIAPGHIFAFALLPLRDCASELLNCARAWLVTGLQTFGLGAKTAAGYGWFDASDNTHIGILESLEKSKRDRELAVAKAKQYAADKAKQEETARRKKELDEKLAQLSPEQQEDAKVGVLTDDQFRSALDNYGKRAAEEQKAIVRAMRLESSVPLSRRAFWDDLKAKVQKKGGKYAQTEQAIRQLSKQMYPGKEGKMP